MFVADHHSQEQLQVLDDALAQEPTWKRSQAVLLATRGWTAPLFARPSGSSLRAVENRVARSNRGGVEAPRDRPRAGRPRRLAPEHSPRPRRRLDTAPRPEEGAWTPRGLEVRRLP